jgi:hypothetical protein
MRHRQSRKTNECDQASGPDAQVEQDRIEEREWQASGEQKTLGRIAQGSSTTYVVESVCTPALLHKARHEGSLAQFTYISKLLLLKREPDKYPVAS